MVYTWPGRQGDATERASAQSFSQSVSQSINQSICLVNSKVLCFTFEQVAAGPTLADAVGTTLAVAKLRFQEQWASYVPWLAISYLPG